MIPGKRRTGKRVMVKTWLSSTRQSKIKIKLTFIRRKTRKFQRREKEKLTDWPFEALFVLQGCCPHIWELCFQEPIHPSCDRNIKESSKDDDKSIGEAIDSGHTAHKPYHGSATCVRTLYTLPFICHSFVWQNTFVNASLRRSAAHPHLKGYGGPAIW